MPALSSSVRTPAWAWLQTALLAVNLGWTTLCLGGYRPETMVVTAGLTSLLLLAHFAARFAGALGRSHPAGKWLLPFLAYAAANVLWVTPVRWLGWHDWLEWGQMIAIFWVVLNGVRTPAARTALLVGVLALAVVAVGLGCYQRFVRPDWLMLGRTQADQFIGRSSGPFGIPNSLAAFLMLLLPATLVLAFRRGSTAAHRLIFGGVGLVLALGLVLTISRGAWLGLALALAAWPLFATGRNWIWRLSAAVAVLAALLAAGGALYFALPKVRDRLDALVRDAGERTRPVMWRVAWKIFRERPAVGGGAGGYNVLFEKHRPEHFQNEPQWAHNDYLNTLCDYGATGFILFFGACGVIAWRCGRGRPAIAPPAAGLFDDPFAIQGLAIGVLAFALQLFVDFHLKIPALAMILATVAALIVQRTWPVIAATAGGAAASARHWNRLVGAIGIVAVLGLTGWLALPHYRGEASRYGTRREIDGMARHPITPEAERALIARAREEFKRATELDPTNGQAWADRAYVAALWSHYEPQQTLQLGREAEDDARRALARSQAIPEFWVRLGVSLDMQGKWAAAGDGFVEAQRLAPSAAMTWYYQAYHLALNPTDILLAKAAIAICLRLDPGNREAETLRERLAASR